jgi:uncharacterized surface protein with fasciclin (FAS1) repeats
MPEPPRRVAEGSIGRNGPTIAGSTSSARGNHDAGGTLTATMKGSNVVLTDEKGGMATITQADVFQSNGVIHVIDSVVLPS